MDIYNLCPILMFSFPKSVAILCYYEMTISFLLIFEIIPIHIYVLSCLSYKSGPAEQGTWKLLISTHTTRLCDCFIYFLYIVTEMWRNVNVGNPRLKATETEKMFFRWWFPQPRVGNRYIGTLSKSVLQSKR